MAPGGQRGLTRRSVLAAAVVGACGVAGTAPYVTLRRDDGTAPRSDQWTQSTLQIIAHPDDDLYFMNPDLSRALDARQAVTTVVLTAGEADGRNIDVAAEPAVRNTVPVDFAGYSRARHRGQLAAYAWMATGDATSAWTCDGVNEGGGVIERWTLTARPNVVLYYVNLAHEPNGTAVSGGSETSLRTLWSGQLDAQPMLVTPYSPVPQGQRMGRDGLLDCLVGLMERHRPTIIRTMDPDPEHDSGKPGVVSSDHVDHTATAQFALAAIERYGDGRAFAVDHYRAYANRYWPYNLSAAAHAPKRRALLTYGGADGAYCPTHDCGDYQIASEPDRSTHIFSTVDRYQATTGWLVRAPDGRLEAYAVRGGRVARWAEKSPGSGRWTGPTLLDGGRLTPRVTVAVGRDGRTHLVALRRSPGQGGDVTVDVVHAVRAGPGGSFTAWQSLDGPNSTHPDRRRQREVGVPTAAVDGSDHLHVFVRNFGQGLSQRAESAPGAWGHWTDLGGRLLQDAPTALTLTSGRIEVYAPNKTEISRWYQKTADGPLIADVPLASTPVASGGLTAAELEPDRVTLFYRQQKTAHVLAYRQRAGGAGWPSGPADLGGHDGTGPVAALAAAGSTLLVHRNGAGTVTTAIAKHLGDDGPAWSDTGGQFLYAPAVATDHSGRAVIAVIGVDGRLHVRRQNEPDATADFGAWLTV